MIKKVAYNTLANYFLKGIQLILNLIAIPILVGRLGEEGFGIILFAGVVVGYFNVLELGISGGVTKYVAQYMVLKDYDKIQKIINTSLNFFIRIGLLVGVLIVTWSLLGGVTWLNVDKSQLGNYSNVFILAGLIALTSWPQMLLKSVFQGLQDFVVLNITLAIGRVFSVVSALLIALYTDLSITYIFLVFNLDKILLTFWHFKILKKKLPFWSFNFFSFDKKTFRFIFSFSGWVMLGQIAVLLEYQADQLIIISFLSASYITVYSVVFYLFRLIQQISGLAASAVMPAMSQMNEASGLEKIQNIIFKGVKLHNLIFVPLTIVLFFVAEPFIKLWMGEKYLEYLWLIKLSVVFQLVWQSNALFGQIYMGLGYSKKPGIIAIIVGMLNVVVSIILVNFIGVSGVILGTICVGVISVPIAMIWMLPEVKISVKSYFVDVLYKTQAPIILGSLVFFFISDWINSIHNWGVLIIITTVLLSYLLFIGFIFSLNKEEKDFFKNKIPLFSSLNR